MSNSIKVMNQEVLDLVGFLLSDGSMNLKKSKNGTNYRISLETVSRSLCEEFQRICKNVFKKTAKIKERHRNLRHSKTFRIDFLLSLEEAKILQNLVKTFRTKPVNGRITEAAVPEEIMKSNTKVKQGFLRIFASAEGSVHLHIDKQRKWWVINRWVAITCCHPLIQTQVKQLLEDLGIHAKVIKKDIIIKGKENLVRFQKLIGFLNGCRVTKKSHSKWEGTEKNQLLNLAIKLFEVDKKHIQKMTKDEIFLWLRSLLKAG